MSILCESLVSFQLIAPLSQLQIFRLSAWFVKVVGEEITGHSLDHVQETICLWIQLIYSGDFPALSIKNESFSCLLILPSCVWVCFLSQTIKQVCSKKCVNSQAYRARSLRLESSYAIQLHNPAFRQDPAKNPSDTYKV